jgi:membrane protein
LITIVPFLLLLIRVIGYFFGSLSRTEKYLFIIGAKFFPGVAPNFLLEIQSLVKNALFANNSYTFLNFLFLAVSSSIFINSIWMGVFFITDDKKVLSWWRFLKGGVIIGMSLLMLGMVFLLPPIIIFTLKTLQKNFVVSFLWENIDSLRPYLNYILKINVKKSYWLNSNILHLSIILSYFTFLYRWLMSWKISLKEAFIASLAFTLSMFIGKSLFWIYLLSVKRGLVLHYGEFYSSIIGVIWLFYLMCFFFYGISVCHVFKLRRLKKGNA